MASGSLHVHIARMDDQHYQSPSRYYRATQSSISQFDHLKAVSPPEQVRSVPREFYGYHMYPQDVPYGPYDHAHSFDVQSRNSPNRQNMAHRRPLYAAPQTPYMYPYEAGQHWMQPPVELIVDIQPGDVLSGRGGATNSHSGNKAFRKLVKSFQTEYLQAKKRDKPAVASKVVDLTRQRGGRFLKKQGTDHEGRVLWMEIGHVAAREKTCQALRENAPELRRQKATSSDEEELGQIDSNCDLSPMTTGNATTSSRSSADATQRKRRAVSDETINEGTGAGDGPFVIRPFKRFLPMREEAQPLALDELSPENRELYLRDFLPPDPVFTERASRGRSAMFPHSPEFHLSHSASWPSP